MDLLKLMNEISNKLYNKSHYIGIFIDFSKAVDTIDHALLYQQFEYYGIRIIALDWFTNYLSIRKQFLNLNGIYSFPLTILFGIPHGSIHGPLLFLIYISDIVFKSKLTKFIIFADDANIVFKYKNLNTSVSTLTPSSLRYIPGSN